MDGEAQNRIKCFCTPPSKALHRLALFTTNSTLLLSAFNGRQASGFGASSRLLPP